MENITVAAISVRNLIGQANTSIDNMTKWASVAREKGAELILFPELNVSGYIPAHEQFFWEKGTSINVFDIGKAKLDIAICRDAFFDEMTRTLYFKGAEIVLMPFGYYNVPRSQYLKETIHVANDALRHRKTYKVRNSKAMETFLDRLIVPQLGR